jgi:TonB family protein
MIIPLRIALLIAFGIISNLMAASLTGKWNGAIYTNDGPIPISLVVDQDDGKVSGSAATDTMKKGAPIENAEIRGDELSFEIHDDRNRVIRFRLILADTALRGEATVGTEVSKVALSRPTPGKMTATAPALIYKVEPEYTEEARAAKVEGTVILYAEIAPDGTAKNLRVRRSNGSGLDEKAIECVKQWKFKPAEREGKPVTAAATLEVNFRLTKVTPRQ